MVFKRHIFSIFFLLPVITFAQTNAVPAFETLARQYDSTFTSLYYKKDAATFNTRLKEFITRYQALPPADQKSYKRYCINAYYNLSCTYALINNKALALENLEKSIKAGYYNYAHIQSDTDLDGLRNEPAFKTMVEPLREVGDYMYILKKGAAYNGNDQRALPAFTYQKADDVHLTELRKAFRLDSIAGTGNEVSKILNLLHWIHNLVPHDGNHDNPTVKNAMSMIAVCKRDNRGLNCRGLAITLNECYLALGIPSRFVTCLPKDSLGVDPDCHVINAVFAKSLNKWIWIDPTNDAYVMNEKGDLQSIEEVREALVTGKPLIVNPDANWNHKESTTKENYLYHYMAKNLYILQCNTNSEYDNETFGNGKTVTHITLLPLDYFKQQPDKTEGINKELNTTFINYRTNNPKLFWQAPGGN